MRNRRYFGVDFGRHDKEAGDTKHDGAMLLKDKDGNEIMICDAAGHRSF